MRSWPSPPLTSATSERMGDAPPLRLYDRRTGGLVGTAPEGARSESGGRARLYVCGITPYDATHMGHAATYLAFDLMIRAWRAAGRDVTYVQNVTDVDDPLLERAAATGEDWRALAERETQLFREDMTALAVIPPDHYVGAVESIPLIVDLILLLRERGAVYDVEGDLYFDVSADPAFGEVSGLSRAGMLEIFAERGGDPDRPGKRDQLDCLLWQGKRDGEPHWDSELGPGRPGWHVECAAIAMHYLGRTFDVQGGGSDLAFPHHEMSAAEGHVAFPDEAYARLSAHAGMVGYQGHKMSKSRGNLVLVSRLRAAGVDPRAIRLTLLSQHYRSDWEWTPDLLVVGEQRLAVWDDAVRRGGGDPAPVVQQIREALADDLDAPAALAVVDSWAADSTASPAGAPVERSGEVVAAAIAESLGVLVGPTVDGGT